MFDLLSSIDNNYDGDMDCSKLGNWTEGLSVIKAELLFVSLGNQMSLVSCNEAVIMEFGYHTPNDPPLILRFGLGFNKMR